MKSPSPISRIPVPKILRYFAWILFALMLLTILGAGWYGYKKGLTRRWRHIVFEEFRTHGIEATFQKLTLDPFRGLVARDVTLFDPSNRQRILAEIDEAVLSIDISNFFRKKPFLNSLEIRDSHFALPLNDSSKPIDVRNLRARVFFPNEQIHVAHAEANVAGCRVQLQGWLTHPSAYTKSDCSVLHTAVLQLLDEMGQFELKGENPLIHVSFSGDLAKRDSLTARIHFNTEQLNIRGYPFASIECSAAWHDSILELEDLTAADKIGKLRVSGQWNPETKLIDAQIDTSLDPVLLSQALKIPYDTKRIQFSQRPHALIHITQHAQEPLLLTAFFEATQLRLDSEPFTECSLHASWQADRFSIRDFILVHPSGKAQGNMLLTPKESHLSWTHQLSHLAKKPITTLWSTSTLPAFPPFTLSAKTSSTLTPKEEYQSREEQLSLKLNREGAQPWSGKALFSHSNPSTSACLILQDNNWTISFPKTTPEAESTQNPKPRS